MNHSDSIRLRAAVGWLELGNWREANSEVEGVTPASTTHLDVLQVRCKIYLAAEKWDFAAEIANALCWIMPDSSFGPLHLAHALRKQDRTEQARDSLLPISDKFPGEWRISYQLACYMAKLGDRKASYAWLELAIDAAGKTDIRLMALDEPDLATIWPDIAEI